MITIAGCSFEIGYKFDPSDCVVVVFVKWTTIAKQYYLGSGQRNDRFLL